MTCTRHCAFSSLTLKGGGLRSAPLAVLPYLWAVFHLPLTFFWKTTWILPSRLVRPRCPGTSETCSVRLAPLPASLTFTRVLIPLSLDGSTLVTVIDFEPTLPIGSTAVTVILCWPTGSCLAPCQSILPLSVAGAFLSVKLRISDLESSAYTEMRATPVPSLAEAWIGSEVANTAPSAGDAIVTSGAWKSPQASPAGSVSPLVPKVWNALNTGFLEPSARTAPYCVSIGSGWASSLSLKRRTFVT